MVRWFAMCAAVAAVCLGIGVTSEARADESAAAAALVPLDHVPGWDISWPQCGKAYPPGPVHFAVIGINNGKPFTANPCFSHQYDWARRVERNPAVYVNTAFPKPADPHADTGPYGACAPEDGWCRGYNFGYGLAREVHERARSMRITPSMYWLDVETGNYWSSDPQNNSQVIRAAIDYLRQHGLPVGIYGTPYQWRIIAGTWQSPGIPIWTAGAQGVAMAATRCTPQYAFAGGIVAMVQYYDWGFDTNYLCPGSESLIRHPEPHPIVSGPRGRTTEHFGEQLHFWRVVPMVSN